MAVFDPKIMDPNRTCFNCQHVGEGGTCGYRGPDWMTHLLDYEKANETWYYGPLRANGVPWEQYAAHRCDYFKSDPEE